MAITKYDFYMKYRDKFDGLIGLIDSIDTMLELIRDVAKEEAYENLRKWFLTDDLEFISDYLTLIEFDISKDSMDYIRSKFGIEDVS